MGVGKKGCPKILFHTVIQRNNCLKNTFLFCLLTGLDRNPRQNMGVGKKDCPKTMFHTVIQKKWSKKDTF